VEAGVGGVLGHGGLFAVTMLLPVIDGSLARMPTLATIELSQAWGTASCGCCWRLRGVFILKGDYDNAAVGVGHRTDIWFVSFMKRLEP